MQSDQWVHLLTTQSRPTKNGRRVEWRLWNMRREGPLASRSLPFPFLSFLPLSFRERFLLVALTSGSSPSPASLIWFSSFPKSLLSMSSSKWFSGSPVTSSVTWGQSEYSFNCCMRRDKERLFLFPATHKLEVRVSTWMGNGDGGWGREYSSCELDLTN